jgi:hypothetical protein
MMSELRYLSKIRWKKLLSPSKVESFWRNYYKSLMGVIAGDMEIERGAKVTASDLSWNRTMLAQHT